MSWAHDDLIVEMRQSFEQQLTPQQKMARCKQKRHEQMQRWVAFDTKIGNNKVHFQYHQPRRKITKTKFSKISNASNENHIYFAPNVSLLDAVNRGDVSEITNLLKNGVDPNCADEDGLTALHQACIDNNEEIVKTLLEYGSNVDCRDSEDWTPLHACTTCGHMNIAKILIEHGADILALNADLSMPYDICEDDSPMLEFIENIMEEKQISQKMINEVRARPEQRIINEIKNRLERQENSANTPPDYSFINHSLKSDPDNCTILHIAAANGYLELAKFVLIELGANANSQDVDGWAPLHAACCWSQKDILPLLIDHNADFNLRNKAGEKPIDVTDDQDTIFYLNRLIREQRQKARQRAREIHEVHENTLNKFNRSQSSRRSARSLSFRRRSYRKNNTQVQVASNSDSQLLQNPAREEARLEAQYWRGDRQKNVKTSPTKSSSPVGKTSLPSSPTREVEKVNKAVVITNPNIEKRNSQSPSDLYKTSRLNSQSPVNKSSPNRAAGQQPKSSSCCVIL